MATAFGASSGDTSPSLHFGVFYIKNICIFRMLLPCGEAIGMIL